MAEPETESAQLDSLPAQASAAIPPEKDAPASAPRASVPRSSTSHASASSFPPAPSGRGSAKTKATTGGALGAYETIARSARLPDLVAITYKTLTEVASARRSEWTAGSKVTALADEASLPRVDADTAFGNAIKVLEMGPDDEAERALAKALWAHAVAEAPRADQERIASDILWLATHTPFDATSLLDRALGEDAAEIWIAIADSVRRFEREKGTSLGRAEALVACAALAQSESAEARELCRRLSSELTDPVLVRVLPSEKRDPASDLYLEGEAIAPPRGMVATTLLALSGILFVVHVARLVGRLALAYQRPAEVVVSKSGVRVRSRTLMLGRTLRETEHVIPRDALVRVTREVRYPRAAFYAGLLALALGSYIGVRAFADGVRAASPSLLVSGLLVIAFGIGLDFVLGSLLPGARGRSRLAFVPKSGPVIAVGEVDAKRADDVLANALQRH